MSTTSDRPDFRRTIWNVKRKDLTVRRNRLINLLVEVQPMELLVHHCSAPERRLGNQGS